MYLNNEVNMERKKRLKIVILILAIILIAIAAILLIDGLLGYRQHKLNQKYIHPNKATAWACKEINMKVIYDNNSESSAAYSGELILNDENTNLSMGIIGTSDIMEFYKTEDYNKADDGEIKLFSGEFNFKNEKEFELKITDNKFLPDDINKQTFEKISD